MHLYRRHYNLARQIIKEDSYHEEQMPPMEDMSCLSMFLEVERKLRVGDSSGIVELEQLPSYWRKLGEPLLGLFHKRHLKSQPLNRELKELS
ncbi:MAG: hypothetical protein K0U54_09820 [Bacteroidetes bacterium]|nr:hypothetical protein [Bacteroidota bacterium]